MIAKRAKPSPKRRATARGLSLPESVLKLFPKTSRMGRIEPSQWGQAKDSQRRRDEANPAPETPQEVYR